MESTNDPDFENPAKPIRGRMSRSMRVTGILGCWIDLLSEEYCLVFRTAAIIRVKKMTDDAELLDRYIGHRSEAAFAELVERHFGIVYHAAMRQLGGDADQAKDISQLVFVLLAQKAPSLRRHPCLAGWLHVATHRKVPWSASHAATIHSRKSNDRVLRAGPPKKATL